MFVNKLVGLTLSRPYETANPLPTNDAYMHHGLSISQWEFIQGDLILGVILFVLLVSALSYGW